MIHCPEASMTWTFLSSSSRTPAGGRPTLVMRLPCTTSASLAAAGRPDPSIRVP
jgi:hypothetical protein